MSQKPKQFDFFSEQAFKNTFFFHNRIFLTITSVPPFFYSLAGKPKLKPLKLSSVLQWAIAREFRKKIKTQLVRRVEPDNRCISQMRKSDILTALFSQTTPPLVAFPIVLHCSIAFSPPFKPCSFLASFAKGQGSLAVHLFSIVQDFEIGLGGFFSFLILM